MNDIESVAAAGCMAGHESGRRPEYDTKATDAPERG